VPIDTERELQKFINLFQHRWPATATMKNSRRSKEQWYELENQ